jgi:hypothetical protein
LGVLIRAVRNISRRKVRALLVIIALGFCMAIMISIPAGITANQASAEALTQNLSGTITQTEETIDETLTQIECTSSSRFEGFGFAPPDGNSGFAPPEFGGGFRSGEFGGGVFGGGGTTAMNETLYTDISSIANVAAIAQSLQASVAGQNVVIGGDIIIALSGTRITVIDNLSTFLEEHTLPDQTINVTIIRNDQETMLPLNVGTRP